MCHNPDNFEPLAEVCASVRTILAVEPKLIRSDVPPEKFILLRFSGLFGMSVQNPDNFSYLAEVQFGQYRAAEIFLRPDNSRLG